jgi:hypothetical protein
VTIRELYAEALMGKHYSLQLVIELLVNEKKVLTMADEDEKLSFYLQDKFANKMNEHLLAYESKKFGSVNQ